MLHAMAEKLRLARSVILTTHRHSDGDGLGAQIALYHGLHKLGKLTRIVNVDSPARKYRFLNTDQLIEIYSEKTDLGHCDLALILDTNDGRLAEPLFSHLRKVAGETLFIDHHPVLEKGPAPTADSLIDVRAASTGQLCFYLLKILGCTLDATIARALYTSVVFDTQLFRYVKSEPESHLIAAELLRFERSPEEIHRKLFANYTVEKVSFLMKALNRVQYLAGGKAAFIPLRATEFQSITAGGLERDESGDVIDQVMNIETVEVAAMLREDGPSQFKLSMRSKGQYQVLSMAESFGGGGHRFSSGAHFDGSFHGSFDASHDGSFEYIQKRVLAALSELIALEPLGQSGVGT
jgi:phosphoesterase RecJ-like protein